MSAEPYRSITACWFFLGALAASAALHAEVTMQDIIENVRRNEAMYDNIDVTVLTNHNIGDNEPVAFSGGISQLVSMDTRTKFVNQDGLFRIERAGNLTATEGRTVSASKIRAFDGGVTRLFEQKSVANVIQGRADDPDRVRPHMMLFRASLIRTALSTYLGGHVAMRADPLGNFDTDHVMENTYRGEADFEGLRCHKVWITTGRKPAAWHDRWELWLAEDRNWIPVRVLGYTFHISKKLPLGEGTATEFREIEPGIWFPFNTSFVGYKGWVLQTKGTQQLEWRQDYVTEDVSLHPHYPREYFKNVRFGDGTHVYEVQDAKISGAYVQGAPSAPKQEISVGAKWWRWTLLVVNASAFALLIAVFLRRRRTGGSM